MNLYEIIYFKNNTMQKAVVRANSEEDAVVMFVEGLYRKGLLTRIFIKDVYPVKETEH